MVNIYLAKNLSRDVALSKTLKSFEALFALSDLQLLKMESGKPYLNNSDYKISITHSQEYVVTAIASENVGVDIQAVKNVNYKAIVKKYFKAENVKNELDFFNIWVKKEAQLKLSGEGLLGLSKPLEGNNVVIYNFIDGYFLAVASEKRQQIAFYFIN